MLFEQEFSRVVRQNNNADKDQSAHLAQLLELALAWDAIEVAKEHIIKDDLSDMSVSISKQLDDTSHLIFVDKNQTISFLPSSDSRSSKFREYIH